MTDHFIKNIQVKYFKCFDNFKADGFARVNLIGGKNNVGKTAFMEACYVNAGSFENLKYFVSTLRSIKVRREFLNFDWEEDKDILVKICIENSKNIFIKTNINTINFKIKDRAGIKRYFFQFDGKSIDVNVKDYSFEYKSIANCEFIDIYGLTYSELNKNYSFVQKKDDEKYIDKILNSFDSSIDAFKVIGDFPQCKIGDKYLEINELGDGVRHLVSIVTSLYATENGHLFIDEIDNGIHYAALDNIWRVVLTLSKQLNVQVFATTHSKECIESYARVAKKLEEQDITYTILSKLKDGSIDAGVYDSEMLANTLEQNHEVRGW